MSLITTGTVLRGGTEVILMVFAPLVVRLAATRLVVVSEVARFSVELVMATALMGAAGVPAVPVRVNVPWFMLIVPVPGPLTIVLALNAPPLTLMVPAVPAVRV